MGSHHLPITGRTGLGGTGSPAQGVVGASCQGQWGAIFFREPGASARGDGESCPGGVRSLLPGQWGAIFCREPGAPARGGRGVLPRGCSESPARPMGGHLLQRTGRTGPGGTGSPAQGVFGSSCQGNGGPSSSENRAHRPGGDGESCPGGVRSLLPGQWGAIFFREPGAPARGGRGVLPRGCSESPARPVGGHLLQWAVELLQCTAPLLGGSGQCNSCNALPHCPRAVGSGTLAMHCLTAWGQRTVQPLQCTASLPWVSGQCNSCNAPPHCPGGSGQCNSCNALPHCLGAVGSATPAIHCRTAWGQWAAQLLQRTAALAWGQWAVDLRQYTAALPGGSEQCSSCITLPHCLGAVDSATPAMHCLTVWGQWAVELLQRTAPLPGGIGQCNFCNTLPHCLGAVGSATPAMHCLTALGQWAAELLQRTASLPGSSGQCNSCNALPHCLGAVGSATPAMGGRSVVPGLWGCTTGRTGLGGWGVQPRGWSGHPSGPMGGHHLRRTGRTGLGGRGVQARGWSEPPAGPMGRRHLLITGRTGLGGTGSPAQGVVGTSCKAHGEPSSSNNRAHRPGGDGESSPGGGRSLLPGPMGGHLLQRTGRTGPGGTGSPAQGVFGVSCQAKGGPSSSENRAHRPGGDGESCPGGVRSLLPGQWGAIFFREPGAPARGGRGVLPRGCSESPARPMGGHLLQRTGRTGPGGTGSPAQWVFGVSCQAKGGPSSSENRAHRPGGDGESCPGGVRSLLPGQWGAIFFREPGAPARGGRGVLPRGCSESPARPMGGHLL